jgi:hypothetical protein
MLLAIPALAEEKSPCFPADEPCSCYDAGYAYGSCATAALHGISTPQCKDVGDIPEKCKGTPELQEGTDFGVKVVTMTVEGKLDGLFK